MYSFAYRIDKQKHTYFLPMHFFLTKSHNLASEATTTLKGGGVGVWI